MATSYNQDVKNKSREKLISHAIQCLTTKRNESYVVSPDHFNKITDHFKTNLHTYVSPKMPGFKEKYDKAFRVAKQNWNQFYNSTCVSKTAAELKVLYLSGPEPLNDIDVLCKYGIRLENIWAVEADKSTYESALKTLKDSSIYVKLHRGKLNEFFELVNHEFDLIYYDACCPIINSKDSPLEVLKQIFINRRLTGLSVLITNFAEPKDNKIWSQIMGCWFATKDSYEVPDADINLGWETYMKSTSFKLYADHIEQNLHEYYDAFITHFIAGFAGEIIPMWQMASLGSIQNKYLSVGQELFKKLEEIRNYKVNTSSLEYLFDSMPHYSMAIDAYPLLNWSTFIRQFLPSEHTLNQFLSSKRKSTSLEDAMYIGTLLKCIEESGIGYNTFIDKVCSTELKKLLSTLDFFDRDLRITCDIPMKNLLVELLYGMYAFPYIANSNNILSLKYKAKDTVMFSNVFVFDQCRYLYDYLPTPDLWRSFFENFPDQTMVRGCIDGIRRNHLALNSSLFKWGFIEGLTEEFGSGELARRIDLNNKK